MTQYRESNKKRSRGTLSIEQNSKWQSFRSSSENPSPPHENTGHQGSIMYNEVPTCQNYQKKHWSECRRRSMACYGCGQEGNQVKDCPRKNKAQGAGTSASALVQQPPFKRRDNQPWQGRAFTLVPGNTPVTPSVVPGILPN